MSKKIIIPVFFIVLWLPILNGVFKVIPKPDLVENRRPAEKPVFKADSPFEFPPFSRAYTRYYNDHFSFRGYFVYWNNLLNLELFGISGVPMVLAGKEGWLFMDKMETQPGTVEYFRSVRLFSRKELLHWKQVLEQRRQWLAARGISYLFVIVPNKNSIYPEKMPERIRKVRPYSRMDQLVSYLKKHSAVPVADARKALVKAKTDYPAYSRTDTHWNDYGAYIAYREIMKYVARCFKEVEPLPFSRFNVGTKNRSGGDLAQMLSLHREVLREDIILLRPEPPLTFDGGGLGKISRYVRQGYTQCNTARLPNIMVVHDSFYKKLKPYLSASFSRVLYIWDWNMNFYPDIIEREKPKLVIDEMAERFLMNPPPGNPEIIQGY
ncbi:MAG: hypothetical protein GY950_24075 [bacterium]|nr:hypothetical protein [bacterium]